MILLIWYAVVFIGFILSVKNELIRPKKIERRNYAREFLQNVMPWNEPHTDQINVYKFESKQHGNAKQHH